MNNNDAFYRYHPIVNLLYFVFVIGFSMVFRHPIYQLISLLSAIIYNVECEGKKAFIFLLKYAVPLILLTAIINPVFNHEGITIIRYLPMGNPLTFESIIYGISAGVMFASVLIWFSNFNRVFTTDKFVYLFGKVLPALSLLISMTLRFIPKFQSQIETVKEEQKSIGVDTENGSIFNRMKNAFCVFSIVITWSLENSIETSDSMKSRGYGTGKRTAYSIYQFEERDYTAIISILALGIFVLCGSISGGSAFRFYPSIKISAFTTLNILLQVSYFALCIIPVILNRKENAEWNAIHSKM